MSLYYKVTSTQPASHIFEIELILSNPQSKIHKLHLPTWIPGSYLIREFAKNIIDVSAYDSDGALSIYKTDKCTWEIQTQSSDAHILYRVYAWDLSVRMAHLDQSHAYFNGTSLFLSVEGLEDQPHTVELVAPKGTKNWKVATTLPKLEGRLYEFGLYQAETYDALIDHPVEMGTFELLHFEACGVPHEVALTGIQKTNEYRLCTDLEKICRYFIEFFGEPAPMDRYLFQVMVVGTGYGGLEHRASTSLICSRKDLPQQKFQSAKGGYLKFLGLCSHEYFHTWNVKQIKPEAYLPYDLSKEAYSVQLWAFEGITSYYDDLCLKRCGIIDKEAYLELIAKTISRVLSTPGRHVQSVADSSFDTWIKFYRQDENAPNSLISYYAKGSLIALCLDLHLRLHSDISLDDVMKALWNEYGKPQIGVPEDGIQALAERLSGLELNSFFHSYVYGTEELPLETLLNAFAITLNTRPKVSNSDAGGSASAKAESTLTSGWLGATFSSASAGAKLRNVYTGSPAQLAGMSANDVVIAIDNIKVDSKTIFDRILGYPAGAIVKVHAFRRDELHVFDVVLQSPPCDKAYLTLKRDATEEEITRLNHWLR
ncbi:MAG: PDZ domain-containing protein [Myxococcota bacterium]|nr:PDZ domain-containing protein [Myxococcota bacterium]